MSRRHTRPPSSSRRRSLPTTPVLARSEAAVVAADLPFRMAVDGVLTQLAAERAGATCEAAPSAPATATARISTTVPVAGMTCRSCENRIQRNVGRIPNVLRVRASAVNGRVEIESSAPIAVAAIATAIKAAGYEVGRTPWLERDPAVWATAGGGLLLVPVVAVVASVTGLAGLASGARPDRSVQGGLGHHRQS
jgi:copper chaperone CopZ